MSAVLLRCFNLLAKKMIEPPFFLFRQRLGLSSRFALVTLLAVISFGGIPPAHTQDDLDFEALLSEIDLHELPDEDRDVQSAVEPEAGAAVADEEHAVEEEALVAPDIDEPFGEDIDMDSLFAEDPGLDLPVDEERSTPETDEPPVEDIGLDALFMEAEDAPVPTWPESDSEETFPDTDLDAGLEAFGERSEAVAEKEGDLLAEAVAEEQPAQTIASEDTEQLRYQEEVKRQAKEVEGLQRLEAGYAELALRNYQEAVNHFEKALVFIPVRDETDSDRRRAAWGLGEAYFRLAEISFKKERFIEAETFAVKALEQDPQHRKAARLVKKIERVKTRPPKAYDPRKNSELTQKWATVEELIEEGKRFFKVEEYDRAELRFEQVLAKDAYNTVAMRYLRKIAERKYKIRTLENKATFEDMMQEVRDTWNPPVRRIEADIAQGIQQTIKKETDAERLRKKMEEIIIKTIDVKAAVISDLIDSLVDESRAVDPEGVGINVILNLNLPGGGGPPPAASKPADAFFESEGFDDEFGDDFDTFTETESVSYADVPTVTIKLRNVSFYDAIRFITENVNLTYRIEANAVVITPQGAVVGPIVTRLFPVNPSLVGVIVEREEFDDSGRTGEFVEIRGRGTRIQRADVKVFFEKAGVQFPRGTSITYNPATSTLIVANTLENLDRIETILNQIDDIPPQVEIEARFIEVAESDLEELGLEWILTDDYEIATKDGNNTLAGQQTIQINQDSAGGSKGLRFFGLGSAGTDPMVRAADGAQSFVGNILTFASVLTNPEMEVILHAISQHGGANVLSAPKVTTMNGEVATIEVVQEILYPTEFESEVTVIEGGDSPDRQVVTIIPGSFEKREVGVILKVTPSVAPDGQTIELNLFPRVDELLDWMDYGGSFEGQEFTILQPVFASRNVETRMSVWDGQTVVMGGLITERLVTIDDKVPILGDIPILGRLFRNKGELSEKQNLLIFVTANIVDRAGRPLKKSSPVELPGGATLEE